MSTTLAQFSGVGVVRTVGTDPGVRRRLAEMGIRPGASIRVLYGTTGKGRVVSVGGARIALDKDLSAAIEMDAADA